MQTTIAAIYIKVSSPHVAEAEVSDLLRQMTNSGCTYADENTFIDATDELGRLVKLAGTRTFDVVYVHREVTLEDRDAYLGFIKELYQRNVSIILCE
jgi:hypothetical protein